MNRHVIQLIARMINEWEICSMTMGTVFGWPDGDGRKDSVGDLSDF